MLAKTQCKVDQLMMKNNLRDLLKQRSLENLSKETKDKLDLDIKNIRNFLQVNRSLLAEAHVRH